MNPMIIETKDEKEELMWPYTVIAGASTLVLNEESFFLLPTIGSDQAISIDNAKKCIRLRKGCLKPVVIDCQAKKVDIIIEQGADVKVLLKASLKSFISVTLKDGSSAQFYLIDQGPHELSFISNVHKNAKLSLFEIKTAVDVGQNTIDVKLLDSHAEVSYFGLDVLNSSCQKSTNLTIFHCAEKTTSRQTFRGIYSGQAQGKFLGKVVVEKPAKLSSASQLYRSVILSEKAKAHTMPQLEIYNHDISASHGASIGELDQNAVFYLCSRGLSQIEAKSLLVKALVDEVVDQIKEDAFKKPLSLAINEAVSIAIKDAS